MAADLATLAIHVDANTATQSVKEFGRESEKAASSVEVLEGAAEGLEVGISRLRASVGLGLFGLEFVHDTVAAQDSMAQLEAGVRSTGGAAGFTAEQLRKQAYEMEELTTQTHVAVEETQGILLLFQRLSGKQFEEAELATANLAARMKTDMPDAARQLGRALEDPEHGLMALRRAGVIFTDGQIEMVKQMVLAGDQIGAQGIILDELSHKLEGSAAAARDTLGGALKGVLHDFDNLFEVTRVGSSPLISTLNAIGEGLRALKDHSEILSVSAALLATSLGGKLLSAISGNINGMLASRTATIAAAEADVVRTRAIASTTEAEAARLAWEVKLADATLVNARANEQCAYTEEARIAAEARLRTAEEALVVTQEAETAAVIATTEAQIAEITAVETLATASSIAAAIMAKAGEVAAVAWKAIGGWIGVAIGAALAMNAALDYYLDKQQKVAEQTQAQSAATDEALAKERQRNAAIKQKADAEESARLAAAKANIERDAETSKLRALNGAYIESAGALKIMSIELGANVEKAKAHKDVKQAEWTAIDRSIDALTREQIAEVRLAEAKKATQDIIALRASNARSLSDVEGAGTLQVASAAVTAAQLENADASAAAQTALEHLQNQIDAAGKAQDAYTKLLKDTAGATQQEIDAARAHYNETLSGIDVTRRATDANIDAKNSLDAQNRSLAVSKQLRSDMNALLASNSAASKTLQDDRAIIDAESDVTRARFLGGQAIDVAQAKLEHLQNALAEENAITTAGVQLKRASVNATDEQIRAAIALYDTTVTGIEQTRQLKDANIDAATAANELGEARSRAFDLVRGFFDNARSGAKSFWDYFKQQAEQAITDLIEKRLIDQLFKTMPSLSAIFGGSSSGGSSTDIFALPSKASTAATIGQGLGIAGAGFGIGSMVGGMTENHGLAALGGAASGAATGAAIGAIGGPIGAAAGAIIGGAAGLVGGFFGAKKAVEDFGKDLFGVSTAALQIRTSLADWRAQITGTAADQARANSEDLRWKYLQLVQTIEQVEAGKKQEDQRNKDLAEAAELYQEAQKSLTKTTNALTQSMLNAVQGYKYQRAIFEAAPFGVIPSTPSSSPTQSGGGSPAGSSGQPTDGGGALTVKLVMADGTSLGSAVINDWQRRQRTGDQALQQLLGK